MNFQNLGLEWYKLFVKNFFSWRWLCFSESHQNTPAATFCCKMSSMKVMSGFNCGKVTGESAALHVPCSFSSMSVGITSGTAVEFWGTAKQVESDGPLFLIAFGCSDNRVQWIDKGTIFFHLWGARFVIRMVWLCLSLVLTIASRGSRRGSEGCNGTSFFF